MLSLEIYGSGMALLGSVFEKINKVVENETVAEQWYRLLQDLTDNEFMYAVESILKTSKFSPTIAEIREKAWEYSHKEELTGEQAWEIVLRDVREKGWYREPKYENPILERTKNAITWEALCDISSEQLSILRRHFIDIYNEIRSTQKEAEVIGDRQKSGFLEQLNKQLTAQKGALNYGLLNPDILKRLEGGEDNGKK